METEPTQIVTTGDGSGYVKDLVWSGWGQATARGTGLLEIDNCNPNCAQGTYHISGYRDAHGPHALRQREPGLRGYDGHRPGFPQSDREPHNRPRALTGGRPGSTWQTTVLVDDGAEANSGSLTIPQGARRRGGFLDGLSRAGRWGQEVDRGNPGFGIS